MTGVEVPACLTVFGAPPTRVTATVVRQSVGRRTARAVTALGACWGFAVVAVFIPVAHFLLVPGLVITGVVLAIVRAREAWRLARVHGMCPRCRLEQQFERGGGVRRRTVLCPNCRNDLVLTLESDSAGS